MDDFGDPPWLNLHVFMEKLADQGLGRLCSTESAEETKNSSAERTHWPTGKFGFLHQIWNLVGGWATPLKNMSSSIGMISNLIYGKIKNGNQTTNQKW